MLPQAIIKVIENIIENPNTPISFKQTCELAYLPDSTPDLLMLANRIREKYKKNKVFTCSIINAKSGRCSENCAFCAQSGHHRTGVETYPMKTETEMTACAIQMKKAGATQFSIVTSGLSLNEKEIGIVASAAEVIKDKTGMNICGSLGCLTKATAQRLREGGVSSYHHNLETSRSFFDQICTTHKYDEDIETVKIAKAAGFRVCSGGILGLGESWKQRVELAFTLKELDVDSLPINFLNPIPGTPMESRPLLPPMEALKCVALFRIINPTKDIPICGGREKTLKDLQSWIFLAGANGLMLGNYLTTEGRNAEMDREMIKDLGLTM